MLTIRPEFMKKIQVLGLTDRDAKTFEHFTYDVNQIDYRLAAEYPGMEQVFQVLKEIESYEIKDMITKDELDRSREWILSFFFEDAPNLWNRCITPMRGLWNLFGRQWIS